MIAMIHAGSFLEPISILQSTYSDTSYGKNSKVVYSTYLSTRANVKYLVGSEIVEGMEVKTNVSIEFMIRYQSGIDSSMRVFYKNKYYKVNYIREVENGRYLVLNTSVVNE